MTASAPHSMRADELPDLLIVQEAIPATEPSQGVLVPILLVLLAALIVVGSWWVLSSLFMRGPSVTPASTTKATSTPPKPVGILDSVAAPAAANAPPSPLVESAPAYAEMNSADNEVIAVVSEMEARYNSKKRTATASATIKSKATPTPYPAPARARPGEPDARPMSISAEPPAVRAAARVPQSKAQPESAVVAMVAPVPVAVNVDPGIDVTRAVRVPRPAIVPESERPQPARADVSVRDPSPPADVADVTAMISPPEPMARKFARRWTGVVVIVNKANTQALSRSDVSNIYRDRITRWPSGERILAFNLPLDSGERQRFSTEILAMSPIDAETELSNRTITNRSQNEYRTKNVQVVVSYVERHANAIGYVPAAAVGDNDNVRVVFSLP